MANDLRLSAVVDDKFSAPLKKLQEQLKQVGDRQHVQRFKDQQIAFKATNESVAKLVETMKGGLAPVMSTIGLAGVGLTGALGAIVTKAQEAGDKLANLGRMAATVGLKPQQILNDQALLAKYGIAADQANAALKTLATTMFELEHRQGALHQALVTEGGAIGQAEDARLQKLKGNLQAQLEEYLKWLNKIQNAKLRAHYAAAAGDPDLGLVGTVSPQTLQKQIEEARKDSEKATPDDVKRGQEHQETMNRLSQRANTGWNKVSSFVNPIIDTVLQADEKSMNTGLANEANAAAHTNWIDKAKEGAAAIADWYNSNPGITAATAAWNKTNVAPPPYSGAAGRPLTKEEAWYNRPLNIIDTVPENLAERHRETERAKALARMHPFGALPVTATPVHLAPAPPVVTTKPPEGTFQKLLHHLENFKMIEPAEGAEMGAHYKPIELQRATDDDDGVARGLGASRNIEINDSTREKLTNAQKDINTSATLLSLRDVTLDAERRIAEWWKRGILKGMADISSETPNADSADGAAAEQLYNPSGANASRTGGGGGDGKNPYVYNPSFGAGNLTKLITEAAQRSGIDPRIMEGIRAGESGHGKQYDRKDDAQESSWGPFQLNRRRGLGVEFERDTAAERAKLGFGDLHDPRTIPMQADWVARYIKRHGGTNGQWMGYHGPRDADPRWGDSGYNPPEGEAASTLPSGHGLTKDYGNLHLYAPEATAGGPAEAGLIALAHHFQDTEGGAGNVTFHAFRDRYHVFRNPNSFHNRGLAFDASLGSGGYEAARQRLRAYLASKGMAEGDMSGRSGDFAVEPGTGDHLHVQFASEAAAERYLASVAPQSKGYYAIGDSIAKRVQMATGMPGMGVVGASPADILKRIKALPDGSLAGKHVLLSGGASNAIGQTGMTEQEIEAIKAKGAKAADIMLLGVGDRADFQAAKVNERLRGIAKATGAAFEEIGQTADRVHPTMARAKAIADDLKTPHVDRAIGAHAALQPRSGANGRMDVHFHNVPSHLRTQTKIAGDLFTKVNINRGAMMPSATA